MKKGNLGISLVFYATLGFVLALMGQTLLIGVLILFVLFTEKDEWTVRQLIVAIMLLFLKYIMEFVISSVDTYVPYDAEVMNTLIKVAHTLVDITIWTLAILGIISVKDGKDANIPLATSVANLAYGKVAVKPVYQQAPQQQYQQAPQQQYQQAPQQQYQQPQQPQQ